MADTRNKREVVDIGKFVPYDHPQYGPGAIREVTYIDGTIERRFFHHGTQKEGEGAPDEGYLVDTKVDPKIRADWDRGTPAATRAEDTAPPGGKPFIDDGPEAGKSGRRWGWNATTKAYDRDLGSSPAAQKTDEPQTGESRMPADRPGWTKITRVTVQGGNKTEKVTFVQDGSTQEVDTLPEKPGDPKTTLSTINGQPGYRTVATPQGAGKPDKIEYFDPSGKSIPTLPAEEKSPAATVGSPTGNSRERTQDGKKIKEVEYALPGGKTEWRTQESPETTGTKLRLPPGAPAFDGTNAETAFKSYQALFNFINPLVLSGQITREDGIAALSGPHELTGQLLDRAKEERQTNENLRRDQLTERSQDMTQTGNRLNFSQNAAQTAIKQSSDLIKGAEGGSSTIVPLMVLQAGMGQAAGGFRQAPSVTMGSGMLPRVAQQAGAGFTPPAPATVGQAPPMTAEHAAGIMANPAFRPPPPVTGSVAMPGAPAALGQGQDLSTPPPPLTNPMQAPGNGPTMKMRDPWGNEYDLTQQQIDNRPGGSSDLTPVTQTDPQAMIPTGVLKSGLGVGTRTADDLERELLAEGYSAEEVRAARQRAESRYGGMGAVA